MAIHDHLEALAVGVRSGTVPLERFVITKGLNKNPRDYPDCKGQAHLQVSDVVVRVVVSVRQQNRILKSFEKFEGNPIFFVI